MKKIILFVLAVIFFFSSPAISATKPSSDADLGSLSYVFYLYFENGQLVGDRDYEIKFDVVNEKFSPQTVSGGYKLRIFDSKSELIKTVDFDPKGGDVNFIRGKIQVKAPYASNGARASFFDNLDRQLMSIFVTSVALCNNDGFCNASEGENVNTCSSDCRQSQVSVSPSATIPPAVGEEMDLVMILTYVFGGLAVIVGAWFGWRWWKKKKEENFLPPSSEPQPPVLPPSPPQSGF